MPRPRCRFRPDTLTVAGVMIGLLLPAVSAFGQAPPSLGPDGEVGGAIWVRPALSSAVNSTLPVLGLGAALRLTPRFELGGEAVIGLHPVRVSPPASPDRSELSLGYAGVHLRVFATSGFLEDRLSGNLLAGAGTARIRSALVGTDVATDNFAVFEPSLSWRIRAPRGVQGSVGAGYRFTFGSDPLPGVDPGAIQGVVVSVAVILRWDP